MILYAAVVYNNLLWPLLIIGAPAGILYALRKRGNRVRRTQEIVQEEERAEGLCAPQNIRPETTRVVVGLGGVGFRANGLAETVPVSDDLLNWHARKMFKRGVGSTYYRPVDS